jgi:DNA-directed RNA polymerase subunit RPC12/RpoP
MKKKEQYPPCPKCASKDVIPVVYGYPGPGLMEASEKGKVKLGGCVISHDMYEYFCKTCKHEWGSILGDLS